MHGTRVEQESIGAGDVLAEERAQSTLEYAIVAVALLALSIGFAALWHAGEDGALARLAERAASHSLEGLGALDIPLY